MCFGWQVMAGNRKIFALKRIRLQGRDEEAAAGFIDEIELLRKLQSKLNIIQLIDAEVCGLSRLLRSGRFQMGHPTWCIKAVVIGNQSPIGGQLQRLHNILPVLILIHIRWIRILFQTNKAVTPTFAK